MYSENSKNKKHVINYLCNWQYTWSSPFDYSLKNRSSFFRINTNSKEALWRFLRVCTQDEGWCIEDTIESFKISNDILTGLIDKYEVDLF